eukprot:533590-Amphidinium_carterae.1
MMRRRLTRSATLTSIKYADVGWAVVPYSSTLDFVKETNSNIEAKSNEVVNKSEQKGKASHGVWPPRLISKDMHV